MLIVRILGVGERGRGDLAGTFFETHHYEDGDLDLLPAEVSNPSLSPVRTSKLIKVALKA